MAHHWMFVSLPYTDYNTGTIRGMVKGIKQPTKWGIGKKTVHRKDIAAGDKVLFYQAGEVKGFVGTGEIASALQQDNGNIFDFVLISDIILWDKPVLAKGLLDSLSFVRNKRRWGFYFRGGVKRIGRNDYELVLHKASR